MTTYTQKITFGENARLRRPRRVTLALLAAGAAFMKLFG